MLAVTYKDGVLVASDTLGELLNWTVPSGEPVQEMPSRQRMHTTARPPQSTVAYLASSHFQICHADSLPSL